MSWKLKLLPTAMALAATLSLAAPASHAEDPEIITISGAGPQGRWFKEASVYAKVLSRELPDHTVNGVIGKGVSVGNIKRIAADRIEAGRFYRFDLENAHAGVQEFDDGNDYSNVLVWMKLGTHLFRVVAETDVKDFSDLKGKTVAIGVKGGGDDAIAERILVGYGVTADNTDFQYVGRSDGQAAFANGQIDAIAYLYARNNQGHLGPVFAARKIGEEIDFVEPDPARTEEFLAQDDTFFLDEFGEPVFGRPDLKGIAVYQGMAIRADLSEDLVYEMTKALYENWDEVLQSAPWWAEPGEASLESAPAMTTVDYHPGAIRYYKEQGVWDKYHGS
jgi:TRAP transporter TAXI family solute receptor